VLVYLDDLKFVIFVCIYVVLGFFCSCMFVMWGDMVLWLGVLFVMCDVILWVFIVFFFFECEDELKEFEEGMVVLLMLVDVYFV